MYALIVIKSRKTNESSDIGVTFHTEIHIFSIHKTS